MSKRKENIRKSCDEIDAVADLLIGNLVCNYVGLGKILKKISHRIKRTTWRNEKKETWLKKENKVIKREVHHFIHY